MRKQIIQIMSKPAPDCYLEMEKYIRLIETEAWQKGYKEGAGHAFKTAKVLNMKDENM